MLTRMNGNGRMDYYKQYYEKNKDKKYHCECCDTDISYTNKSRHEKTKQHMENYSNIPSIKAKREARKRLMEERTTMLTNIFKKLDVDSLSDQEKSFIKNNKDFFIDCI